MLIIYEWKEIISVLNKIFSHLINEQKALVYLLINLFINCTRMLRQEWLTFNGQHKCYIDLKKCNSSVNIVVLMTNLKS